ncbi:ferric reductase NAD binding domain-containing protein [Mycena vitilis]|nr:ferric reductase NAD binding domain-containing protein [Mycena vitilis]
MNTSLSHDFLGATDAAKVNPDKVPSIARNNAYPNQIWYLLASFIALVSICHFTALIAAHLRTKRPFSARSRSPSSLSRLALAAVHVFRTVMFRTTASFGGYTLNFAEFFLGAGYIVVIFTWEFVNTTDLEGNRFALRYYANRAGQIAATQFPLLIALGMKNNIIGFLTGISFDKLNLLHRIVARVLCVLLWIHAGGRVTENMEDFGEAWFRWGFVVVTSLTMFCALSVRPLRKRGYEMFLVAHFFVGLCRILLIGSFIHTKKQKASRFVWPSFVLWGLDRLLRYLRIFLVNGGYFNFLGKKDAQATTPLSACVEVVSSHLLRVTVHVPDRLWWAPGQVAHLSVPGVSRTPWEAHPFSISNLHSESEAASADSSGFASRDEKQLESEEGGSATAKSLVLPTPGYSKKMVFLVRVRGGFTKRLREAAPNTCKAFVDGPYGAPPSLNGFGTVLLFAGGSGVSFTLPLLLDLIRQFKAGINPACGRVVFVWAVREAEQIRAVSDALARALNGLEAKSLGLEIRIHVTSSIEDTDGDAGSAAAENADVEKQAGPAVDADLASFPCVQILAGRPDVDQIVCAGAEGATGAVSVNVCGSKYLAGHVRKALRAATSAGDVLKGGARVNLYVEAFGDA